MAEETNTNASGLAVWAELVDGSTEALWALVGFGLFQCWTWMGLYLGYPIYFDGGIDQAAVGVLFGVFAAVCLGVCMPDNVAARACSQLAMAAAGVLASVGCAVVAVAGGVGLPAVVVWCGMAAIGAGAAFLMVGYGVVFSRLRPVGALLGYCLSYIATLFVFFGITIASRTFAIVLFSALPLGAAGLLYSAYKQARTTLLAREQTPPRYARGFVKMVVALPVFMLCSSLTQSFEPIHDFALSVDQGVIVFGLVLFAVSAFMLRDRRTLGTFKVLKVLYQVAVLLMVFRFVLQPLASSDTYFAAFNVLGYFMLFMAFWLLTAYVGYVGDVSPTRAFALTFGLAAVAIAVGWILGKYLYGVFGHDRLYVSIAVGCVVAVFCSFGFSIRDFPRLSVSGKGIERMVAREASRASANVAEPVVVTQEMVLEDVKAKHLLSTREGEVLALLVGGKTVDEVAEELVISPYTVRAHIRNLYAKMEVGSRSELFAHVYQHEGELAKHMQQQL